MQPLYKHIFPFSKHPRVKTLFSKTGSHFSQNGHFKNVLFSKTTPTFFLCFIDIQKTNQNTLKKVLFYGSF
jgi:hypothetical protein